MFEHEPCQGLNFFIRLKISRVLALIRLCFLSLCYKPQEFHERKGAEMSFLHLPLVFLFQLP